MNRLVSPLRAFVACCLLLLAACEEKHEPTKPTVDQVFTPAP